ncbi:hypothetical protein [Veillonella ratti]|uniref:hypothetical protein n=1 Tax=Veillonella ratti TaxID=103892 RepID=UPI0013DF0E9B|nr:hypothetical protein [Veillonella ratti]
MQLVESIRDKMQDSGTRLLEILHNRKVYERKDENGYARMISQPVFNGIDIVYNDVVMERITHNAKPMSGLFEIHFCQDGRIECSFENGKCLYMNGAIFRWAGKHAAPFVTARIFLPVFTKACPSPYTYRKRRRR